MTKIKERIENLQNVENNELRKWKARFKKLWDLCKKAEDMLYGTRMNAMQKLGSNTESDLWSEWLCSGKRIFIVLEVIEAIYLVGFMILIFSNKPNLGIFIKTCATYLIPTAFFFPYIFANYDKLHHAFEKPVNCGSPEDGGQYGSWWSCCYDKKLKGSRSDMRSQQPLIIKEKALPSS